MGRSRQSRSKAQAAKRHKGRHSAGSGPTPLGSTLAQSSPTDNNRDASAGRRLGAAKDIIRRIDIAALWLLFVPVVVLWRDLNPLFSRIGAIDPWVYYGYFRNLIDFKRTLFPHTYYGSRLSWILPGSLVTTLLPPLAANCMLHLGVYYIAVYSFYFILKRTTNGPTALLWSLIFAFHPYLWKAVGWDYVDGVGIAYYLLTFALITRACVACHPRLSLIVAGASCACMVFSNLAWIGFSPFFLVYYLCCDRMYPQIGRRLLRFILCMSLGIACVTGVLACVNHYLDGRFWFYEPSLRFAFGGVGRHNPWKATTYAWVQGATWLIVPALALTLAAGFSVFRMKHVAVQLRATPVLAVNALFSIVLFLVIEIKGQPFLQLSYYASYLIAPAFLALGTQFSPLPEKVERRKLITMVVGGMLVLGLPWWDVQLLVWRTLLSRWALAIIAVCCAMLIGLWFARRHAWVFLVGAFCILSFCMKGMDSAPPNYQKDAFLRISQAVGRIEALRQGRPIRFWITSADNGALVNEYDSLNSVYLWGYTQMGRNFPKMLDGQGAPIGTVVVVTSARNDLVAAAIGGFSGRGRTLKLLSHARIERAGVGYFLGLFEVVASGEVH